MGELKVSTSKINKTKIEWCDYTINPVKGLCPVACDYCYARRMYKRFKWDTEIRWDDSVFWGGLKGKKSSRYFIGSTIDLFGKWIEDWWMTTIFDWVKAYPQRTFILLTKCPDNLIKWSPFPDNCWVGISATDDKMFTEAIVYIQQIKARVKYISLEPLLGQIGLFHYLPLMLKDTIQWVIIGQQTPVKKSTTPKIEWVSEIIEACDKVGIPVFLKDNLRDFIYGEYGGKYKRVFKYAQDGGRELRQEFPK